MKIFNPTQSYEQTFISQFQMVIIINEPLSLKFNL